MDGSLWQVETIRGYVAMMEGLLGVLIMFQAQFLADPVRAFLRGGEPFFVDPRLLEVLERRRTAENISVTPWYVFGGISIVLALGCYFQLIPAVASYLLLYVAAAAIGGTTLLRMRNRSARRAAVLTPRESVTSVVPTWLFVTSAIATLAPLALIAMPGIGYVGVVAMIVGFALIVLAWVLEHEMATVLTGDDPAVEIAVEQITRRRRVSRVLLLAVASSAYFMMLSGKPPHAPPILLPAAIVGIVSLAILTVYEWYNRAQTKRLMDGALHG